MNQNKQLNDAVESETTTSQPELPSGVVTLKGRRKQSGIPRPQSMPSAAGVTGLPESTPLIQMLWKKAAEKGMTTRSLAGVLGISYPYLMHLANPKNIRSTDGPRGLDKEVLRRAANFLEIPVVQAYVLANILKPEDFFYKPSLSDKLEAAYRHMLGNGLWCGFAPSQAQWAAMTDDLKLSFVMLYEQTANRGFLDRTQVPVPQAE